MEDLGDYTASITDFNLSIHRGAFQFEGFELKKKEAKSSFVTFEELDFGISWRALLQGEILASIELWNPVIKYRTSEQKEKAQTEKDEGVQKALDYLLPIEINQLKVRSGLFEWVDMDIGGAGEGVFISGIDVDARDLRLQESEGEGGPFWIKAQLMGKYPLWAEGTLNLLSDPLNFDVDFTLKEFNMTNLNPMLRDYVPIDITKGRLSVAVEAAQNKDQFDGYVTVGLEDGDIIGPNQNYKSAKHMLFEVLGGVGNFLLQNSSDKVIATFPLEKTEDGYGINTDNVVDDVLEGQDKEEVKIENSVSFEKLAK